MTWPVRRFVPITLGVGMFVVVVLAALTPNTGAVPAQTSCQYGNCPNEGPGLATWAIVAAVVVLVALVALALLLRRRRRGGSSGGYPESLGGGPSMGATAPEGPAGAPYIEGPDDVGQQPPVVAPAGAGAAAGAAEGGGDIDSLMQELDRISGEILQRGGTPPKRPGTPPSTSPPPEDETPPE